MMDVTAGFEYGTGLSLGFCVGLVTWIFLRTAVNWLLGITWKPDRHLRIAVESLDVLYERNALTKDTISALNYIASCIKKSHD
jgi:hypothetical protein